MVPNSGQSKPLPYARQTIEDDDIQAVVEVLRSDRLTTGAAIERFEDGLANAVGAPWAVAVSSGTAALHAACFAAGVGEGDRVIAPAISFLASANCARYLGAEVVFADVDPDTGLIDPGDVARLVDERTRAVVVVHLTGMPARTREIERLARDAGATVIEDACHALGASDLGTPVGSCRQGSSMATFSFHAIKQITTGEGGAITGRDPEVLRALRSFRNHGMVRDPERLVRPSPGPWYYEQQTLGHNLRMTELQAALGCSQLQKLERFLDGRRALAARYDALLEAVPEVTPVTPAESRLASGYHLYAVLIDFAALGMARRDLMEAMSESGITTQVHYIPIPMQPYYAARGADVRAFPGAMRYYERTLSLPLFPAMTPGDVERVVETLARSISDLREERRPHGR